MLTDGLMSLWVAVKDRTQQTHQPVLQVNNLGAEPLNAGRAHRLTATHLAEPFRSQSELHCPQNGPFALLPPDRRMCALSFIYFSGAILRRICNNTSLRDHSHQKALAVKTLANLPSESFLRLAPVSEMHTSELQVW